MFSCASILPKHNELVDLGLFIVFCYLQEPCQAGRFLGCIIYFWPLKKKKTTTKKGVVVVARAVSDAEITEVRS